jgi:membrane protein DedA with SNARE-associated domain
VGDKMSDESIIGWIAGSVVGVVIGGCIMYWAGFFAESKLQTRIFEERIAEHACKIIKINGQASKIRTCIQPDGLVFSEK